MEAFKIYFLNATSGKGEKGDYYRVTLNISEKTDGKERDFSIDCYVDVDVYAKAKVLTRFQEVDAIFMPKASGAVRLVSIEGL